MPLGLDVAAKIINYQNHLDVKHPKSFLGEVWLTNSIAPNDKKKIMSWAQKEI